MNILVLNPILFSGEENLIPEVESIKDTMIYNMCLAFIELGHRVTLLAMEDYRPQKEEEYDFELVFFKNEGKGILPAALPFSSKMYKYIKQEEKHYHMILSSEAFGFHTFFAALVAPEKTVIWQELVAHQRKMKTIPSRLWHRLIVTLFFRKVRVTIGRSFPAVKFISNYIAHVSAQIVDHGIDISQFKLSRQKKQQFIVIAQLVGRKQIDQVIDIFSEFLKMSGYESFKLLIAGRGPLEATLKQLVGRLSLEENIVFLGFVSHQELNSYLSESYASLVRTKNDLNMVSITESIVSGTPVICNRVSALSGFIENNRLGIAKDNWNEEDLVAIVGNEEYHKNCIAIREKLSTKSAATRIVDIFLQSKNNLSR
ncbi:MAG: glycosyltransferase [Bacteroidetes bacterium]|nr:glycosyltransferase [Bacteroidota bacterium]